MGAHRDVGRARGKRAIYISTHRDAPTHAHPRRGARGAREARHSLEAPRLLRGGDGEHPSLIRRFGDATFVHNRLSEAHFHTYTPHLPTLQAWGFQQSALLRSAGRTDTHPPTPGRAEARGKRHPHIHTPRRADTYPPTPRRADTHPQTHTEGHGARGKRHLHTHTPRRSDTHPQTRRGVQGRAGSAPFVRSPTLAAWGKRRTSLSHPALRRCAEGGGGKQKNRRASRSAYSRTIFQYEI